MKEKIHIYDRPIIKTQKFELSIPGEKGRVFVERKEVIRQAHNTACDEKDCFIDYDVYKEVDILTRKKAIQAIQKFVEEEEYD